MARVLPHLNQLSALLSVVIIDIVLAGDNAIVVGMAASSLPAAQRRRAIVLGIGAAMLLRILFAFCAVELLHTIIGMTLAGGLLLLWVCWKMYRELRETRAAAAMAGHAHSHSGCGALRQGKTTTQALCQIVLADLSMSLDNVLAVAGAARDHPFVLAVGLVLSVALMGVASTYVARLLERHFWISWIGLGIITFIALRMTWAGSTQILGQTAALSF